MKAMKTQLVSFSSCLEPARRVDDLDVSTDDARPSGMQPRSNSFPHLSGLATMWFRIAFLPLLLLCVILLFPVLSRNIEAQGNPSIQGRWSFLQDLSFISPHAHVLPTGKVLLWPNPGSSQQVHSWDPATGAIGTLSPPGHNVFCSGHVFLADGRLFVAGGHIETGVGLPNAATYDPFNDRWTNVPTMNAGRWYPRRRYWEMETSWSFREALDTSYLRIPFLRSSKFKVTRGAT